METIILPTDRCQALSQKKVQCHRQTKDRSGFCAIHRHFGGNFETINQAHPSLTGAIQITKDMEEMEEKIAEKCIITDTETTNHNVEKN